MQRSSSYQSFWEMSELIQPESVNTVNPNLLYPPQPKPRSATPSNSRTSPAPLRNAASKVLSKFLKRDTPTLETNFSNVSSFSSKINCKQFRGPPLKIPEFQVFHKVLSLEFEVGLSPLEKTDYFPINGKQTPTRFTQSKRPRSSSSLTFHRKNSNPISNRDTDQNHKLIDLGADFQIPYEEFTPQSSHSSSGENSISLKSNWGEQLASCFPTTETPSDTHNSVSDSICNNPSSQPKLLLEPLNVAINTPNLLNSTKSSCKNQNNENLYDPFEDFLETSASEPASPRGLSKKPIKSFDKNPWL